MNHRLLLTQLPIAQAPQSQSESNFSPNFPAPDPPDSKAA